MTALAGNLFMLGTNGPGYNSVWEHSGSGQSWNAVTDSNKQVDQLIEADNILYAQPWYRQASGAASARRCSSFTGGLFGCPAQPFGWSEGRAGGNRAVFECREWFCKALSNS